MTKLREEMSAKIDIQTRVIASLTPLQNPTGGFGGGHGQYSHLATTYASILSLITVGGKEAYDIVDRKAM